MMGPRPWDRASRVALGAFLVASLLAVRATAQAWIVAPWPTSAGGAPVFEAVHPTRRDTTATRFAVLTGTERNPFRPDRQRPATRYLLPSERVAASPTAARAAAARIPAFRLLGIADTKGRPSVAALAVGNGSSRLVRVGDVMEGFEVVSVETREVILAGPDTTLILSLDEGRGGASQQGGGR